MEILADVLAVRVAWNPPTVHRIKRKRPVLEGFDSPTPDSPISHAAGVFPLGGKESAAIYGAPTNGGDNAPLHRGDMQQLAIGIAQDPLFAAPHLYCRIPATQRAVERGADPNLIHRRHPEAWQATANLAAVLLIDKGHLEWGEAVRKHSKELLPQFPDGSDPHMWQSTRSSLLSGERSKGAASAAGGISILGFAESTAPPPSQEESEAAMLDHLLNTELLDAIHREGKRERDGEVLATGAAARQRIQQDQMRERDERSVAQGVRRYEESLLTQLSTARISSDTWRFRTAKLGSLEDAQRELDEMPFAQLTQPHTVYTTARANLAAPATVYRDEGGSLISWPWEQQRASGGERAGGGVVIGDGSLRRPLRAPHQMDKFINAALDNASKDGKRGRTHTGVRAWFDFCADLRIPAGRPLDPLSPLVEKLEEEWLAMQFVTGLVEVRGISVDSARVYFSSFQGWHAKEYGIKLAGGLKLERLPAMLKGLRRIHGDRHKPLREPISPEALWRAMDKLLDPNDPYHANLRAALATAFQGLLRSAEYCGAMNEFTPLRSDITTLTVALLVFMMHPCKNMQHLTGKTCPLIIGGGGKYIDAVKEVRNMLRVDPTPQGVKVPLFRDPKTNKPISYDTMLSLTKSIYVEAGLNPANAGTHILRISGATALFAAGGSDTIIRTMGRWSSDLYRLYVRACFEQCRAWSAKMGSTTFTPAFAAYDEVEDY